MKKLLFLTSAVLISLSLFGCAAKTAESAPAEKSFTLPDGAAEPVYNSNPDLASKVSFEFSPMGEYEFNFMDIWVPAYYADFIAVVTVTGDGTADKMSITGDESDADSYGTMNVTYTPVTVDYVAYGDEALSGKQLQLFQLGAPNSEKGEKKVENGKTYLVILEKQSGDIYKPTCNERSIFEIRDDNTIWSFCANEEFSKYDGLHCGYLINDILDAKKLSRENKLEMMKQP